MLETVLIDTQILIWMALEPDKLSPTAQRFITDPNKFYN